MVTVEMALGLGSLVLVLSLGLTALGVARDRAELCEQVRVHARAYSLGAESSGRPEGSGGASFRVEGFPTFTAVGTKPAVQVGGWSVGTLRCEVSGIREPLLWQVPGP